MLVTTLLLYSLSFLASLIIFQIFKKRLNEPKNLPKGPRSYWPLIGGLLQTGREPHILFLKLRKTWGNIFSFDLGPKRVVILNHYKVIKEAHAQIEFTGRSLDPVFQHRMANQEHHGILFNDSNKAWSEQRRFTLRNLRDFGFGKNSLQSIIEVEATDLADTLKTYKNTHVLIKDHFNRPVLNTLWSIVSGSRLEPDDPKLIDLFHRLAEDVEIMGILFFYPFLFQLVGRLPSFITRPILKYIENSKLTMDFLKDEIKKHKKTHLENSEGDFIDVYLSEIKKEKDPNSSFYGIEGEYNLLTVLNDLFVAGAETSSTTLNWAVHILALNPEIQEKIHQEIKSVVGLNRTVDLSDKAMLPYLEACIYEVLRYAVIVPNVSHDTMVDIKNFHGFDIPKGTTVMLNLYACLYDPDYWGDPENFRPDRFLSSDRKIIKHEPFLPFSTGKRACLGEPLARDSLFIFMTTIFQNFKIFPAPSMKNIPEKVGCISGGTRMPIAFPLIFEKRSGNE